MSAITTYLQAVRQQHATGEAREHAYRPALVQLLQALGSGVVATNEPRHTAAGAVDMIVKRGEQPVGWLEAKDLGADLERVAKSDQLKRYLGAYPNLILTDYLCFRWYLNGKCVETVQLAALVDGRITSRERDHEAAETLLAGFLAQEVYRPGKPEDLARRMALLARIAEGAIVAALRDEPPGGQLHSQLAAFKETLLPDLSEDQFADMYAQTVAYGLFAARFHHPLGDDFDRWNAAKYLPPTNPFLRRLFHELTGPDLNADVAWIVDELVSLLKHADMGAVAAAFAKHQQGREDPVVHFYETFLKEYNPKERKIRGVYYTPEPVVSYIVRSVDHLLKTEFDKPAGLADPSVLILDPACGTGTFLYFVIEHIHQTICAQEGAGAWPGYVQNHLLGRLFGFELLMAPYTIAHLKLAQLLQEQGYHFPDDQRLGVYLTNTLEEARLRSETLVQRYISEEAEAAGRVKRDEPIMVVLGNPPYSGISANASEREVVDDSGRRTVEKTWIGSLIEDYKTVDGKPLGERKHWLQDDYVKFIRFGQWRVDKTGHGILAFITNHSYLDNTTFRGLRASLLATFNKLALLDLHGSVKKEQAVPDGGSDENVFDIQQGVAIGIFARTPSPTSGAMRAHGELWGSREAKYRALISEDAIEVTPLSPCAPDYYFVPRGGTNEGEYNEGWSVNAILPEYSTAIQTSRDAFATDFDREPLAVRIRELADERTSDDSLRAKYGLPDGRNWTLGSARKALRDRVQWEGDILRMLYRPFDLRYTLYGDILLNWPRRQVMRNMLSPNLALLVPRQLASTGFRHALCADTTAEMCVVSARTKEQNYTFPLFIYPEKGTTEQEEPRRPNLNPAFVADLAARLGLTFIEDGRGDLGRTADGDGSSPLPLSRTRDTAAGAGEGNGTFGPEDVFHYIYAVLHSPTYRRRYAEFLKIDFPRIPLTSDLDLFRRLCELGGELVALHLLKSPLLAASPARYPETGDDVVEAVRYDATHERVYLNKTQYFSGIGPALYEFQVGGYQVMNKWLKDRKGRKLSHEDISHYLQVAAALTHTMRLMQEIDAAIPAWPLT